MNKTTLIIPDLHLRWDKANKIISSVGADEIIFLGDYFDSFSEDVESITDMCDWLNHSVNQPNRIHLWGNHDMHYAYPNKYFQCSGYTQWKYFLINDHVKWDTWNKLKYYHNLDNTWLLTHAGLHSHYIPDNIKGLIEDKPKLFNEISTFLDNEIIKGMRNESWIFHAGASRSGNQLHGGITWCDVREFYPTKGLNQIFGHTSGEYPRWKNIIGNQTEMRGDKEFSPDPIKLNNPNNTYNVCIDTFASYYAIWDGIKLKIEWIGDL